MPKGAVSCLKKLSSGLMSRTESEFLDAVIAPLARRRVELGVSQRDLDARLGVSDGMVAKWESRYRSPSSFFLMLWCQSLGMRLCTIPS